MPIDLASGKSFAGGKTPPPDYPGGPDRWYIDHLQNAVNAGVPAALKAAGLWTGAEAGQGQNTTQGYASDYMGAAPASEWLGKRAPTPRELRRYAKDTGQSEDFARYSDAQLAAWLPKWDVAGGHFKNDFGDAVEKPTESGPLSRAAGSPTGESGGGFGGGGGGGGGGAGRAGAAAPSSLYSPLAEMLANQGSFLSQYDPVKGDLKPGIQGGIVGGGGIWYQPTQQPAPMAPTPATPAPAAAPVPVPAVLPPFNPTAPMAPAGPRTTTPSLPTRGPTTPAPTSSLTNMLAPLQNTGFMASQNPLSQQAIAGLTNPQPTSGLSNLLNQYGAKRKPQTGWFGPIG